MQMGLRTPSQTGQSISEIKASIKRLTSQGLNPPSRKTFVADARFNKGFY